MYCTLLNKRYWINCQSTKYKSYKLRLPWNLYEWNLCYAYNLIRNKNCTDTAIASLLHSYIFAPYIQQLHTRVLKHTLPLDQVYIQIYGFDCNKFTTFHTTNKTKTDLPLWVYQSAMSQNNIIHRLYCYQNPQRTSNGTLYIPIRPFSVQDKVYKAVPITFRGILGWFCSQNLDTYTKSKPTVHSVR